MKRFLTLFLILNSLFSISFDAYSQSGKVESILGVDYSSLLFKTNIQYKEHGFSGLTLIKSQPEDSSYHIVFMSEFGMTLMDLKYKNDEFEIVSAKEFFSHPKLMKLIFADFRIIIQELDFVNKLSYKNKKNKLNKLKFKHLSQKYIHKYNNSFFVEESIWRLNLLQSVKVKYNRDDAGLPQQLYFTHSFVKLFVTLDLIKIK